MAQEAHCMPGSLEQLILQQQLLPMMRLTENSLVNPRIIARIPEISIINTNNISSNENILYHSS